jgi:hypothetical protein
MKKLISFTLTAASLVGAAALAVVPAQAHADTSVTIEYGYGYPPPVRYERAPHRGYVWQPGHWEWRHGRHVWFEGGWVPARPVYAPGPRRDWDHARPAYTQGPRWDWDGDGVPNRYDSRPNNPYRH